MDKIKKFLKKLDKKTRERILVVIFKVIVNNFTDLDLQKLRGRKNFYRVRVGGFRIVFIHGRDKSEVVKIDRRNDRTYK